MYVLTRSHNPMKKLKRKARKEITRKQQIKAQFRHKMCGTKKAYATQIEADGYAGMYSDPRYAKVEGTKLKSYLCMYCNKWHLTSKPQTQTRYTGGK